MPGENSDGPSEHASLNATLGTSPCPESLFISQTTEPTMRSLDGPLDRDTWAATNKPHPSNEYHPDQQHMPPCPVDTSNHTAKRQISASVRALRHGRQIRISGRSPDSLLFTGLSAARRVSAPHQEHREMSLLSVMNADRCFSVLFLSFLK